MGVKSRDPETRSALLNTQCTPTALLRASGELKGEPKWTLLLRNPQVLDDPHSSLRRGWPWRGRVQRRSPCWIGVSRRFVTFQGRAHQRPAAVAGQLHLERRLGHDAQEVQHRPVDDDTPTLANLRER